MVGHISNELDQKSKGGEALLGSQRKEKKFENKQKHEMIRQADNQAPAPSLTHDFKCV